MFVYIASDHTGYKLKENLKEYISTTYPDFTIRDFGANTLDEDDDYPDYILPLSEEMNLKITEDSNVNIVGIVIGGSGTGEAICANRFSNLRAVVVNSANRDIVTLSREHNNANVISFGARFIADDLAKEVLKIFLETKFAGGRHERRLQKIDEFFSKK